MASAPKLRHILHIVFIFFLTSLTFNAYRFQVLPNMASVVDIKALSYGVCGSVQIVDSGNKAKVI